MATYRRVVLLICLLADLVASNAVHAQSAANTFTVILDVPPSDLDPASSYDAESNIIGRGCYEGLVTLNGSSLTDIVPVLAESWDDQKDTIFTFKLRHGVKFHDGTDFNADAAKFGLARIIKAKLGIESILGTFITDPDKMITVIDPYTLRIAFDRPRPLFLIMTDGFSSYQGIEEGFKSHETVDHSSGEYARGDVHTNTVESWFALLKRGVYGTFHHISDQHLDRYIAEFSFRWDNRKTSDFERMLEAVRGVKGKRLMYYKRAGVHHLHI